MLGRPKGQGQGQGQPGQGREGVPASSHPGPDRRDSISAGYGLSGGPPPPPGMRPQQYNGQGGHLSRPSFSHQSTSPTQYQMGFVPQPQQQSLQQQQQAPSPSSLQQQQQQSQQGIPYMGAPPASQGMLHRGHHQQQPSSYGLAYGSGDGAMDNGSGGNGPGFASNGSSPASSYSQQQQQQYPVLPPPFSHQPIQQPPSSAHQQYAQQQPQQQQSQSQQQQQLLPSLLDFDIFAADDDPNAAPSLLDFDVDNLWQNFSGPTGLMMDSLGVPAAMAAANNAGGGMGDAGAAAMGGLTSSAGTSGFTPNSEAGSSQMQGAGMGPQGDATGGFSNGALAGGMGGGEGSFNGSGGAGGATSGNDGQMLGFGNPGGMMMGDIDFSGMSGLFQ